MENFRRPRLFPATGNVFGSGRQLRHAASFCSRCPCTQSSPSNGLKGYPWVVKYILDFLNVVVSTEKTFPKRNLFVQFMHGTIFTTKVLPEILFSAG